MLHLTVLFCTVSVVVRVDAALIDESVYHTIISTWREISSDAEHRLRDKFDEILRRLGRDTNLLYMERSDSIAVYISCMSPLAVMGLHYQYQTEQLRDFIQSLFDFLLQANQEIHVSGLRRIFQSLRTLFSRTKQTAYVHTLSWPPNDYDSCLDFFSSVPGLHNLK